MKHSFVTAAIIGLLTAQEVLPAGTDNLYSQIDEQLEFEHLMRSDSQLLQFVDDAYLETDAKRPPEDSFVEPEVP